MKLDDGRMLPDFIVNTLKGEELVIYGDESFSTSLCYVSDMVDGLVRMMESNAPHLLLNLGSDQDLPLVEVGNKIIELTGSSSKIRYESPLMFMSPLGLPIITSAKDELGWIPITTLERGLQKTFDFAKAERSLIGPSV